MEVFWSTSSEITFVEIIENIERRFSVTESEKFYNEVFMTIFLIQKNPFMFKFFKKQNVRKAVIHPNTSLFYEVDEQMNLIRLLAFFDNRMSQNLLDRLLS